MIYLLKHTFKHLLLFALLTFVIQMGFSFVQGFLYNQEQVKPFHINDTINLFFERLIFMRFCQFQAVKWIVWLYKEKIYLLVLALIVVIIYYNQRQNNLEEPKIVMQPKMSSTTYNKHKSSYTNQKVKQLQESEEYKQYKRDKQMGRLRQVDDNETVAELREKEEFIF